MIAQHNPFVKQKRIFYNMKFQNMAFFADAMRRNARKYAEKWTRSENELFSCIFIQKCGGSDCQEGEGEV